ncbi:unnamed protein product [Rotaria magnacalcarata]|uniref:Metalloendopeptidase n=1 Tax=Rotaria magnacalcarata TaxID=392030 RepID=A0A819THV7_9BILA|nr:unnamed protein product [Rotaria magnacalcarata]CAF2079384.1 unnamed protein product [Rotaria magnacalcarata]CAF3852676.1 unnamed protein product [Rotaria magnacalcarata]CAF4073403.1 unnamed protein product [Rotaria magnacalcarata]
MKSNLLDQCLVFLISLALIQCENQEQNVLATSIPARMLGHNVLQKGRIISKPFIQSKPADQVQTSEFKIDNNNRNKPKYVTNGDILLPTEETQFSGSKRFKRKIIPETNIYGVSNRWPGGIVPYEFISGINYRVQQNVLNAIQHWHQRTCIRFEPYNPSRHWNIGAKIIVEDTGFGCATFVGYQPSSSGYLSAYSLYLPVECPLGSAIHELGHVVGFYHEMARVDRDQEININFNLMLASEIRQYDIMSSSIHNYYGQPYDLGSIMHYYPTHFMEARDNRRTFLMGQRIALSYLDTKLANVGYRCGDNCKPKPVCENEGYINQYCQCTCPDGFYGDQCNLLQGYLTTPGILPEIKQNVHSKEIDKPQTLPISLSKKLMNDAMTNTGIRWLEWSDWSNCSESCGSGVQVRTRLCSNTIVDGNKEPCSFLRGSSFEMQSCQNPPCTQTDIIMSCTFDIVGELCPIKINNKWQIQEGMQTDHIRPIVDHTRGDGKYLVIVGTKNRSDDSSKIQLGPFTHSKLSNENNHCLQFWYSIYGQGIGKLTIIYNKTDTTQDDYSFTFNWKDQDKNWKQIQRTIFNVNDYKIAFAYEPITSEYNYIAIDDISIINGVCIPKKINNQRRRKRHQATAGCSRVIDLTPKNTVVSITSPNYPNLYPMNALCYYYIRAPQSLRVILQFTDFNIPTYNRNSCDDSVEIRYYHLGQPGPTYCGTGANSNNLQFVSSKNYIMIVFRSDQNTAGRGFRAQAILAK